METMKDLFGNDILISDYLKNPDKKEPNHESKYQKFKRENNYRKSSHKLERCKYCYNHTHGTYRTKYLHKCSLLGLSHSEATDIRTGHVCDKWSPDDETAELVDEHPDLF